MEDPCRNECNGNGVCQYEVVDNVTGQTDIIAYDYKNSTQQEPDGKPIGCVCAADTVDPDCKSVADAGCSGNGRNIGGVCACDENFAGVACAWKTCPSDCNDNGYCRDGVCLCKDGYEGKDCGLLTDSALPYQCVKHCAPHCLKACAVVWKASEGNRAEKAHDCYQKCTEPCLTECEEGGLLGSVGASLFE